MTQTTELRRIAQGREAEIFEWGEGRVLRLFRDARSHESVERDAAAMRAARAVVASVPEVFETVTHGGRPGVVMERIDGRDLLTLIEKKPWVVWSVGRTCGTVHAQLHEVPAPDVLPTLHDRIRRLAMSPLVPQDLVPWVHAQLTNLPEGDRLCHGDFHPANVLGSSRGPMVIDWSNATRGAPEADYARSLLMFDIGELPPGTPLYVRAVAGVARKLVKAAYVRAYRRARPIDLDLAARWLPVRAVDRLSENIPEERDVLLQIIARARAAGG